MYTFFCKYFKLKTGKTGFRHLYRLYLWRYSRLEEGKINENRLKSPRWADFLNVGNNFFIQNFVNFN